MKKTKSFKYVAVCQSDIDSEGDCKIMFLKPLNNDCKTFVVDENDEAYIQSHPILTILTAPDVKPRGNRLFYTFHSKIDF